VAVKTRRYYGPQQFADHIGLTWAQFRRALRYGLIPPPSPGAKWAAEVVEAIHAKVEEIREQVGTWPDSGAINAAAMLGKRLGFYVSTDAIVELARRGVVPEAGEWRGTITYDGCVLERLDAEAVRDAEAVCPVRMWEFAHRLGVKPYHLERAVRDGRIPPCDPDTETWSSAVVGEAVADAEAIRKAVGTMPDVGVRRAAETLSKRFATRVGEAVVDELERRGSLPKVGRHKGWALYDGGALERVDRETVRLAIEDARILTAAETETELGVRSCDVERFVELGRLRGRRQLVGRGKKQREVTRGYYGWELRALLDDDSLPWDAMRSAAKGTRSVLAGMTARPAAAVAAEVLTA
jgi:hypothetical protein